MKCTALTKKNKNCRANAYMFLHTCYDHSSMEDILKITISENISKILTKKLLDYDRKNYDTRCKILKKLANDITSIVISFANFFNILHRVS